jgi:hypothetical protein
MDLALTILKIAGVLFTGAFGVLGLLTEFKDKDHKTVTPWGKVALIGIVLSTVLAFVAETVQAKKAAADAKAAAQAAAEQVARTNKIMRDLDRSLNPIYELVATYWLKVPIDAPELASYRRRLESGISTILLHPAQRSETAYVTRFDASGRPIEVGIPASSSLVPREAETVAYYLLGDTGLDFGFHVNIKSAEDLTTSDLKKRAVPDLAFSITSDEYQGEPDQGTYELRYDLVRHELSIHAYRMPSNPEYWRTNAKLLAVPDLGGTQLVVRIHDLVGPPEPPTKSAAFTAKRSALDRLRDQLRLESLSLKISAREFALFDRRFKIARVVEEPVPGSPAEVFYSGVLPAQIDDLQAR